VCKKSLRLVPAVLYGFKKGHSAAPRAFFKEGHCAPVTFYTTRLLGESASQERLLRQPLFKTLPPDGLKSIQQVKIAILSAKSTALPVQPMPEIGRKYAKSCANVPVFIIFEPKIHP
jgi:hypothetical protein